MATDDNPKKRFLRPRFQQDYFTKGAAFVTRMTGSRWAFLTALGTVIVWGLFGPFCRYSENWQLVINTGTTIVTFLMVFLIQNAQNRESKAIHIKLDELILAVKQARNEMIDVEHLTEEQLDRVAERYSRVAAQHQHKLSECLEVAGRPQEVCEQAKEAAHEVREVRKEVAEVREEVEGKPRPKVHEPYITVK